MGLSAEEHELAGFVQFHQPGQKQAAEELAQYPDREKESRACADPARTIEREAATFAVRIAGESMTGAGLFPGDIAVVDRSRTPADGSVVLALLGGEFTIKRYRKKATRTWLQAENPAFRDIPLSDEVAFEVWGVITKSIRML
jgi:SOS-response transcriptional repressor LexA